MRTALNNPFTPGSDAVPPVWAGRTFQISDWDSVIRPRRVAGLPERGRTILGEAGLGKSALVRRIASSASRNGDWVTPQIRIPSGVDPLKLVAAALLELADKAGLPAAREKRINELLERVRAVAASGISITLERRPGPEPFMALRDLLIEIGVAAQKQSKAVLVHVDEVQNIADKDSLSQILIALGDALIHEIKVTAPGGVEFSHTLPLAIYLTGLPEFAELTEARIGATFARRFMTATLEPISDEDFEMALRPFVTSGWEVLDDVGHVRQIRMTQDAADRIVWLARGEPFLFQLAGERAWYSGTGELITIDDVDRGWELAIPEAIAHVERILERLPNRERDLLEAMASLAPEDRSLTWIAQAMGLDDASQVGATARRLDTIRGIVRRGRPYEFRHRAIEAYLTSSWPMVE